MAKGKPKGGISYEQKGKFPRFADNTRKAYNPPEVRGAGPSYQQKGKFPLYPDGGNMPKRYTPPEP